MLSLVSSSVVLLKPYSKKHGLKMYFSNKKKNANKGALFYYSFFGIALLGSFHGNDGDELAVLDEFHFAFLECEKREIATHANIGAGMNLGTALTNDD